MDKQLQHARQLILNRELLKALRVLRAFIDRHPYLPSDSRLDDVERDYHLMLDFLSKGYDDPKRNEIYDQLLRRLFRYVSDIELTLMIRDRPVYASAHAHRTQYRLQSAEIKQRLEDFVSETALLSIEPEETRREKSIRLYTEHMEYVGLLFEDMWLSGQWSNEHALLIENLLLSPTIDSIDVRILISAISLAAMNVFDICKFRTLVNIYMKATDEHIRQRALVGWVFALDDTIDLFPEQAETVARLCESDNTCRELLELQMQIMFCTDAEHDNEKIQKDIIPNLIKNNNLNITRFGITEKEEDPMQDIIDPGASDRAMEEMEQSLNKMMDMQKAGSDIYFGGFSQMKRFAFFYALSNWFTPFYAEHPGIAHVYDKLGNSRLLHNLLSMGPFCDSDKYSFTLALASIIERIPENLREMMNSEEAFGNFVPQETMQKPAYIRRMYLQDLYRFFRLFQSKEAFANPFEQFFFANSLFAHTQLTNHAYKLGNFLLKRKQMPELTDLLIVFANEEHPEWNRLQAYCDMTEGNYRAAVNHYEKAYRTTADNPQSLSQLARACFLAEDFDAACRHYETLHRLFPQEKRYTQNYVLSLLKLERYEEAVSLLFKLDYEHPDDSNVKRILAWGLLLQGRLSQTETEYEKLLALPSHSSADYLNAGYCQWFTGHVSEAVNLFAEFVTTSNQAENNHGTPIMLKDEFEKDNTLFRRHGITETDMQLMLDLVDLKLFSAS
ncbi:tetratricopeptide repeat protein [Hoylesella marshii]|uniref:Tetratricopeptide repeat protein n=1 Tax=Hoylesella marshii DSM 16973 = JCM 13450 TaxID=862515 RepID=E0NQH3_9BACT|nr:tetratricopeptide repeat protein [Hoylesella marshii]EFM02624.1 tetratricopeptide repeat protein [Hoylesella marshii DSM 16973 = JCM 13450]